MCAAEFVEFKNCVQTAVSTKLFVLSGSVFILGFVLRWDASGDDVMDDLLSYTLIWPHRVYHNGLHEIHMDHVYSTSKIEPKSLINSKSWKINTSALRDPRS